MNFISRVYLYTHKKKESQEKTKQQKESTQNKRISLYSFHSFRKIKFGMLPKHNLKTKKQIIKTTVLYLWLKKHHNTPLQLQKPMISVCHVEIPALNEDNVYKDTRWVFFKKHIMKRIHRVPRNSCKTHAPWFPIGAKSCSYSLPVDCPAGSDRVYERSRP